MTDALFQVALELVTASRHDGPSSAYVEYAHRLLNSELSSRDDAVHLVTLLASIAGESIGAWAEDTGRDPAAVLQAIALDAALPFDAHDD